LLLAAGPEAAPNPDAPCVPIGSEDKEQLMSVRKRWTVEALLAAFDEHLDRVRGVGPGARRNYVRWVRAFLDEVFGDGRVEPARIGVRNVVEFISVVAHSYRGGSAEIAATSLRSFFRFLRAAGLRSDRLEDAVPMVPRRRTSLPRNLDQADFGSLLASLDTSSPRGLRDRAIILCIARLGLRASEVTELHLEDIDWRNGTVRVRRRKTGHGALLPLPQQVGAALVDYLRDGRPDTRSRRVFVLHWLRVGAPISTSIVGRAVDHALRRAGIDAPARGANLLRHSLATDLVRREASLAEIAGLFGHSSLATTVIYASVDVAALRQVALPWPVTS
jgi:integrase/recombinase XerD